MGGSVECGDLSRRRVWFQKLDDARLPGIDFDTLRFEVNQGAVRACAIEVDLPRAQGQTSSSTDDEKLQCIDIQ